MEAVRQHDEGPEVDIDKGREILAAVAEAVGAHWSWENLCKERDAVRTRVLTLLGIGKRGSLSNALESMPDSVRPIANLGCRLLEIFEADCEAAADYALHAALLSPFVGLRIRLTPIMNDPSKDKPISFFAPGPEAGGKGYLPSMFGVMGLSEEVSGTIILGQQAATGTLRIAMDGGGGSIFAAAALFDDKGSPQFEIAVLPTETPPGPPPRKTSLDPTLM